VDPPPPLPALNAYYSREKTAQKVAATMGAVEVVEAVEGVEAVVAAAAAAAAKNYRDTPNPCISKEI
jgi:hypothetical protein